MRAIAWIYLSRHSLTSKELLEALSIRENDARSDAMGMTTIETILSITGGLLTYEKESGIVRLMHETLREFLYHSASILPETHLSVLRTLTKYLEFKTFSAQPTERRNIAWATASSSLRENGLLRYAFLNWNYHCNESGNSARALV